MEIKYLGHASFLIKTKTAKIITDPYDSSIGLKFPKISAEIVTISHQHSDHNRFDLVEGEKVVFDMPGEFERLGVKITGFSTYHDKNKGKDRGLNTIFKIEAENINLLHCGDLGEVPKEEFLEEIGEIDILMVPVGGFYTIGADEAVDLVKKIEPSIIIPMHYNHLKLNQEIFGKLASVDVFLQKMGVEKQLPLDKLVIKKEEILQEMKVVIMEIKNS